MTNRVTFFDKLMEAPSSFEARGGTIEIVSLWIEVRNGQRRDRFSDDINDPKCTPAPAKHPMSRHSRRAAGDLSIADVQQA